MLNGCFNTVSRHESGRFVHKDHNHNGWATLTIFVDYMSILTPSPLPSADGSAEAEAVRAAGGAAPSCSCSWRKQPAPAPGPGCRSCHDVTISQNYSTLTIYRRTAPAGSCSAPPSATRSGPPPRWSPGTGPLAVRGRGSGLRGSSHPLVRPTSTFYNVT